MAINKVIFGGDVLIDLTDDTVTANDVAEGIVFHKPDGELAIGVNTYDSDTSDATALASEILDTRVAYVQGMRVVGNMPNRGSVYGEILEKSTVYIVQNGYHDGSGTVRIAGSEQDKIIPGNIKSGVVILGVTGTYTGEAISAQAKVATPDITSFTVLPDDGYDYLSQVTVEAIPYTETPNPAGGETATIG
jgi:hypothetical protein